MREVTQHKKKYTGKLMGRRRRGRNFDSFERHQKIHYFLFSKVKDNTSLVGGEVSEIIRTVKTSIFQSYRGFTKTLEWETRGIRESRGRRWKKNGKGLMTGS